MTGITEHELALLRMVADTASERGTATVSAINEKYGSAYIGLAPDLKARGYLVSGGEAHILALTERGARAIGRKG